MTAGEKWRKDVAKKAEGLKRRDCWRTVVDCHCGLRVSVVLPEAGGK